MKDLDINDTMREEGPEGVRRRSDGAKKFRQNGKNGDPRKQKPLRFVNVAAWQNEPVPPRKWAVENRVPIGAVTIFSGHGEAGKSIVSMMLAAAHVLGRDWLGSLPEPGPVLYLSTEDDATEMNRRFAPIAEHFGASFSDLAEGGLHLLDYVGRDPLLGAPNRTGIIQPTPLYHSLADASKDISPRLIILDALADLFAGKENDRAQARQFLRLLRAIAIAARCGLMLIAHPSASGLASGSGLSGVTDWHNAVRARMYLQRVTEGGTEPDPDLRRLEMLKNNYGPRAETITIRYRDGVFVPETSFNRTVDDHEVEKIFLDLLARYSRQNRNLSPNKGPTYAPAILANEPEAAGIKSRALCGAMNRLLASGAIVNQVDGPPSKQRARLVIATTPSN